MPPSNFGRLRSLDHRVDSNQFSPAPLRPPIVSLSEKATCSPLQHLTLIPTSFVPAQVYARSRWHWRESRRAVYQSTEVTREPVSCAKCWEQITPEAPTRHVHRSSFQPHWLKEVVLTWQPPAGRFMDRTCFPPPTPYVHISQLTSALQNNLLLLFHGIRHNALSRHSTKICC